ncbi:hypothetical protein [Mariniblastus fucicola]|uniref:hypothetical protein n=1 Tax=Mariniblastus fucicola TaxID=980251 RepID=UPI0011E0048B|nr:hypothetical protein [Mariniblastus fucicola]
MRRKHKARPGFQRLEPRQLLTVSLPIEVADFRDDFPRRAAAPTEGWAYLWNAPAGWSNSNPGNLNSAAIDNPETIYQPLQPAGSLLTPDGDLKFNDSHPSSALYFSATGGHAGSVKQLSSGARYNGQDRYAIAAFTVQEAGVYELTDSFIQLDDLRSSGLEVRVFVNRNKPLILQTVEAKQRIGFDARLGYLRAGDTVHVAIGAGVNIAWDHFLVDFSIVRHTSRVESLARFGRDVISHNSRSPWTYMWNAPTGWVEGGQRGNLNTSPIGATSSYQPLFESGDVWVPDRSSDSRSPTFSMQLDSDGGAPGAAWQQSSSFQDRYLIVRYTIPTSGNFVVSNSYLRVNDSRSDGVEVVVHREDGTRVTGDSIVAKAGSSKSFDLLLGDLSAGEHIYFAFGGVNNANYDRFEMDFSIDRVYPRELPLRELVPTKVLHVTEFGATPNDGLNDWHAIEAALQQVAKNNQAVEIRLTPGTWDLYPSNTLESDEYFFDLLRYQNLTFNGMGAEVLIHDDKRGLFRVLDSKNVILRNLVIDYADKIGDRYRPRTFTQGIIRSLDPAARSFELEIDLVGFIAPDASFTSAATGSWGYAVDPNVAGRLKFNSWLNYPTYEVQKVSGNRFRIRTEFTEGLAVGDRYVLQRRYDHPLFNVAAYSQQVSLIGVRAYTASSVFVSSNLSEALNVIRSSVTIRPDSGRWKSGNADGVHAQSNRVGPWIEDSRFQGLGDDVMNFYTLPYTITKRNSLRTLTLATINHDTLGNVGSRSLRIGDSFKFVNPLTGAVIQTARLTDVADTRQSVIIQGRTEMRDMVMVTFDQDINGVVVGNSPAGESDGFRNETTVFNEGLSRDFLVERNYIADSRRFGNYLMADNGELNHNIYVGLSDQAILGRNESGWPLGAWPSNVSIRSNSFYANGLSARYLRQPQVYGTVDFHMNRLPNVSVNRDVREIRRLKIVDNHFQYWRKAAVSVRNAEAVTILDNTFSDPLGNFGSPVKVKFSTFL